MSTDMAMYIGEAGNRLLDGTLLIPGVTVCAVPDGESQLSDLWDPLDAAPADSVPLAEFDGGAVADSDPLGSLDGGAP